jgi:tRNA 2-selenouridine synthase
MPQTFPTAKFLTTPGVLLDVRSPAEYTQGHIPDAMSFPLFSNQERAEVGTCYKQAGRDAAVELGLALVGPKLATFVQQAKVLAGDRTLRLYCWRGGMRSSSMAWLLETAGFQVTLLDRGYKGFRAWVRSALAVSKPILILGGMTGTGKTTVLKALAELDEQVLDLEKLANHRGSSYGALGLPPQPSTEQFENLIATKWEHLSPNRPIWVEAESRMVGTCRIPNELFGQMLRARVLQIDRSREERICLLLADYGTINSEQLVLATQRLQKRLGGDRTEAAITHIQQGNLAAAIAIVLDYYDKTYQHDLQRRVVPIHSIDVTGLTAAKIASYLVEMKQTLNGAGAIVPLEQRTVSKDGVSSQ